MAETKSDIIKRLRREILPLEAFKTFVTSSDIDIKLGSLKNAFPNNRFPHGVIHEFLSFSEENVAVTNGFIAALLASFMQNGNPVAWIGAHRRIFPPAFPAFGVTPDKILFVNLQKEKEMLWAIEEALKCNGLAAVVGEVQELTFTASRRLQLAVEQSHVTGFILRNDPRKINTTASVARWKITSLPSELPDGLPGVGFPRWNVELLKIRNGKPGTWQIEFIGKQFRYINKIASIPQEQKKKTG